VARPHLARLAVQAGETVHLAQLDAGQVLYVDKRVPSRPIEMFSQAGKVALVWAWRWYPKHCRPPQPNRHTVVLLEQVCRQ
jgi:hypothetical protein